MKDFVEAFFGTNITAGQYVAFILFTLIGMALYKIRRFIIKRRKRAREGIIVPFNKRTWIEDNILDVVSAFMSAFIAFRFFPDALHFTTTYLNWPEFNEKMFYGFLLGLMFQVIWHKILNSITVQLKD